MVVWGDVRNLVRALRRLQGAPLPYISTLEVQESRARDVCMPVLNGMVLVPYLRPAVFDGLRRYWRFGGGGGYRGFDLTGFDDSTDAAGYTAKGFGAASYLSKKFDGSAGGCQLYRVGHGFQPAREFVRVWAPDAREALRRWGWDAGVDFDRAVGPSDSWPVDSAWGSWS